MDYEHYFQLGPGVRYCEDHLEVLWVYDYKNYIHTQK